ncbi:hypothetical protein TI05_02835 [Achromatium sp. WMS3]|nr:hypothetical protein TI05_02835 [Achromatium sp. WMS3]
MNLNYPITIEDCQRLRNVKEDIQFGHYFVFKQGSKNKPVLARMGLRKDNRNREVLPLVSESPVQISQGVRVMFKPPVLESIGCLVSNRDLYRAEHDPVHLFIAVPKPPAKLRLDVLWNDQPFNQREVTLQDGVAIETFATLLPGNYEAYLVSDTQVIGLPLNFTVAEYQLAPLTGRLVNHQLDHDSQYLWFELAVDSYQQPFTEQLIVELIEADATIARIGLFPAASGQYQGGLPISGDQALRLRLIAATDPEKIAEIVIPGSRKQERQVSIISELGQKAYFSMMPEPQAIPVRGGYLSQDKEVLATPLLVEEVITNNRQLQVQADIEALTLVNIDLITGEYSTKIIGDVTAKSTVTVTSTGSMSMTFAGGFVNGEPFEIYTTFIQPTQFDLLVNTPKTLKPRENLTIHLGCKDVAATVPVLVCVRDARLTATELPAVSLGAAAKRNIDVAIADMQEKGIVNCEELFPAGLLDIKQFVQTIKSLVKNFDNVRFRSKFKVSLNLMKNIQSIAFKSNISNIEELSSSLKSLLTRIVTAGIQSNFRLQKLVYDGVEELEGILEALLIGKSLQIREGLIDSIESASLHEEEMDTDAFYFDLLDYPGSAPSLSSSDMIPDGSAPAMMAASSNDFPGSAAPFPDEMMDGTAQMDTAVSEEWATSSLWEEDTEAQTNPSEAVATQKRVEFPEMLFYGLVPVTKTGYDLVLPVGESLTTWVVETFALHNGDWAQTHTNVVVDQPVRIDLEVPPAVYPEDDVVGRIHITTPSGNAKLRLHCDNQPVALRSGQLTLHDPELINTPTELEFAVKPGFYQAIVEDLLTHETDSIEATVQEPTKVKSYRKALHLLQSGDSITLDPAIALRLLPTLDTPFDTLVTETAGYTHLCCEQTAAKILAATFMYLNAKDDTAKRKAEQIIITGIDREQKMFQLGRGFNMYPDQNYVNNYYSTYTVRYLWRLQPLVDLPDLSANLRQTIQNGIDMADQAAKAHNLQRIPKHITSIEDAYTLATLQQRPKEVRQFLDSLLETRDSKIHLRKSVNLVVDRVTMAYAAACLIIFKDWSRGLYLANQVTKQFNAQGMLYSTVDSIAALAMLQQLKLANIAANTGQIKVNAKVMTLQEALTLKETINSVEVIEGIATVQATYPHIEDWDSFGQSFPITVKFIATNTKKDRFSLGNRLTLQISLPQGYQVGDIAHIVLPPCLSAIQGGAKVKQFSLDFAGQDSLQISVLVTSKLQGSQHFAICVRNMFEEERASSTGLLAVT